MTEAGREVPAGAGGRMPVLFIGHGTPMNAIEDNAWSGGLRVLGEVLPRPRAILSISAHWYVSGTYATGNERPATIHDFSGFPRELTEMAYPAPGDIHLARRALDLVGTEHSALRGDWGLDHGTWTVLHHLYPAADIPVVQLSIDERLSPANHCAIGRKLAPLRDEGVLILASGNIVHNLRQAMAAYRSGNLATPDWARTFDADVAGAIERHDTDFLVGALDEPAGTISHPTPEHYLTLLYAVGATDADDTVIFPIIGFDLGSLSMRSVRWG